MPVHDWTRVSAGTFHDFHCAWITHIKETLNEGLLPPGYYALAEQHAGGIIADVLTLQEPGSADRPGQNGGGGGGVAVAAAPPRVGLKRVATPEANYRQARRSLAIRHSSGHRLIALIEIASPANKDRPRSVAEFADKVHDALRAGVHVMVVDLLPPGPHDPEGLAGAIWEPYSGPENLVVVEPGLPLRIASYVAGFLPEAYEEALAVGSTLPEMPLFLDRDRYINVPLEPTYQAAYRGLPAFHREVIEGRHDSERP